MEKTKTISLTIPVSTLEALAETLCKQVIDLEKQTDEDASYIKFLNERSWGFEAEIRKLKADMEKLRQELREAKGDDF